ncbi:hypothetical protein ACDI99_10090 [Acinetobacter radioresistens]|uniref:hypothetical protein n=1 Tax=Acinetobacter radioresistens TaxID=40216 RepID=UPI003556439E
MATSLSNTKTRFFDKCGKPLSGGEIYTYKVGSTELKATYTDSKKTTPNTNPVQLDISGSAAIFLDGAYRVRVLSKSGVLIEDIPFTESWISESQKDDIYKSLGEVGSQLLGEINKKADTEYVDQQLLTVDDQLALKAPQSTTYTKTEVDSALLLKAPQETTYTKAEVDTVFAAYVGGRKGFTTLALAQAARSTLPADTVIDVTNDPTASNNGTYQWNGTTLTKSAYDPINLAKSYTDSYLSTVLNKTSSTVVNIDDPSLTVVNKTALVSGSGYIWKSAANHESIIVPITPKSSFVVTPRQQFNTFVVFYNSQETLLTDGATLTAREVVHIIPANTKKLVSAPSFADTMLVARVLSGTLVKPNIVSKVSDVLLSTGNVVDDYSVNSPSLPLSSSRGSDLDSRIKILSDSVTLTQSSVISIDETLSYINDLYVAKSANSPSSYAWATKAGDRIAVIPLNNAISVKIKARTALQVVITFKEDTVTPISGTALSKDSATVVVPKGAEMDIPVPTGKNYLLVSTIAVGYLTRPDRVELIYKKALTSDDVLNTLPAIGSRLPISANVVLDLQRQINAVSSKDVPKVIPIGEKTSVFATHKNFILKDELVDGVSHILISTDLGKTWISNPNTIGKITNFHIFVDGTIMLCGTNKIYWLNGDYKTFNEAIILDHDGSVFSGAASTHHFFSLIVGNQTQYVGSTEIFMWGQYNFGGTSRVWYTADRGRTIKCAIKFGTTSIDGVVRQARHAHMITQRKQDEKFYITTGDAGTENMVFTGSYDVATDTWTWDFIAAGDLYKFGDIFFDEHYAYLVTDYTTAETRPLSGLYRVAVENLGDFSKYHAIFKPKFSDLGNGTLSRYVEDNNGIKIVMPDNGGIGRLWIANGDMEFKYHTTDPFVHFYIRLGINDNGDMYCNDVFNNPDLTGTPSEKLYINHGSYNLTKILRDAGYSNFMKGRTLISDTWIK